MIESGAPIPPVEAGPTPARRFSLRRAAGESLPALALTAILALAAVLRFSGIDWDENTHLHPDERFLTMVETGIRLPGSLAEYFDPARSPLNPHNAGYTFFVYGTFPIFLVRLMAEVSSQLGYDQVHLLGRGMAAIFDLVSLVLLYALGTRLYSRAVGLAAALLGAFTVLMIQHAHFFVVDPFANTFIVAGLYLAVRIQDDGRTWGYALFGLCVGAAAASKISALPLAGVILLAAGARALQVDRENREREVYLGLRGMILAGVAAFLAFRILQPYAFQGPAFWNILPNPAWLADLEEVRIQSSGLADLPFALQWADRPPIWFALQNMLLWGMGLPLGIAAWAGWFGALIDSLRGRWNRHAIPLVWTAAYFAWQGSAFTPAMRYQLPVYPTLILFAAWGAVSLWRAIRDLGPSPRRWATMVTAAAYGLLLTAHVAYGIGFTRIYTSPVTRVAASRWIYDHVPGAVNLVLESDGEQILSPLNSTGAFLLGVSTPHEATFTAETAGVLVAIEFPRVTRLADAHNLAAVTLELFDGAGQGEPLARVHHVVAGSAAEAAAVPLDPPVDLVPGVAYRVRLALDSVPAASLEGDLVLTIETSAGEVRQTLGLRQDELGIGPGRPYLAMVPPTDDALLGVSFGTPRRIEPGSGPSTLTAALLDDPSSTTPIATAAATWVGGEAAPRLIFDQPVRLDPGQSTWLQVQVLAGSPVAARGSRLISESSWDDGLPLRLDGRDAFGGLYLGLNQEIYWSDNEDTDGDARPDKLERLVETLEDGDYLVITSNRQYGSIPRLPIRYPLSTAYYRALFDCPEPTPVHVCAAAAEPTDVVNTLGYRLVETFASHPRLGPIEVNDQTAEEAFTVYDHPKVLIFQRTSEFSRERVEALLGAVDLSQVRQILPVDAAAASVDLMLPADRLAEQRAGGTWAELFPRTSLINRSPLLATVVWWLLIGVLGWIAFPIVRIAFPGFGIGGYALSRALGMLLLSWGVWVLGSIRIPFRAPTILGVLLALAGASVLAAYSQRVELRTFLREHRREILFVEGLALALFIFDLAIRFGNPDLWHPSKGGEKPMDFSYFNAVLRSTSFPPYDPWYAGGYINYYYYGFVLVGVPVRLLGLNPATAYNLILPTLFALLGVGGYGVAYEIAARLKVMEARVSPRLAGLAAAALLVLLGNLGTVRMGYDGLKRIGTLPGEETGELLAGIPQAVRGLARFLSLQSPMPYRMDEWYWNPSRAIPSAPGDVDPITEFPFFTFLYADLHAHMIALPLTILALGWAVSWCLAADERRRRSFGAAVVAIGVGGLIAGSLRPTNTWDFPVYLAFGAVAAAAAPFLRERRWTPAATRESIVAAIGLVGAAVLLFLPYTQWYVQGYTAADPWLGSRTTIRAYLTVHGVFLFFVGAWMIAESIRWMAETPVSTLGRLRPRVGWLSGLAAALVIVTLIGFASGIRIALLALPLMAWAAILAARPGLSLAKRLVLAIVLVGLALTLVVEVVVLRGDIGRMNTVFKFYLQVWTLFSVAAAAAFAWSVAEMPLWRAGWRVGWTIAACMLVAGALLYPLTAAPAKIRDRMAAGSPNTLDGTAFMNVGTYYDQGGQVDLAEDLRAIEWLQDEVEGSPVIVEANTPEYRWGSRATIYTGLPGVLGWNWHQRQQRPNVAGDPVAMRAVELAEFYTTPSVDFAVGFLDRYAVAYVLVGGLERLYFDHVEPCWASPDGLSVECDMAGKPMGMGPPEVTPAACTPLTPEDPSRLSCPTGGLEKFDAMVESGVLREVYHGGDTVIYEVIS